VIEDTLVFGKRLYFVAEVGHSGQELWVTDGTSAGTRALTHFAYPNVFSSPATGQSLSLRQAVFGGKLLFGAFSASGKTIDLWITDGTPAGTRRILENVFYPYLAVVGGKLFFDRSDAARGTELWVSNGTTAGTHLVRDLCPGACGSNPFGLVPLGGQLLFGAVATHDVSTYQLWRTDGTAAGTVQLTDLQGVNNLEEFGSGILPGAVLFAAQDPQHGRELWRTDGTSQGTFVLRDINTADIGGSSPGGFQALGDELLFSAFDGQHYGLWKSDGTAAGTTSVGASIPGQGTGVEVAGRLFLATIEPGSLYSLWVTDGTAAGTSRLTPPSVRPRQNLCAVGGTVYFTAFDEDHAVSSLWKSDGTPAGTVAVAEPAPSELAAFAGRLFFTARVDEINGLWTSDGTSSGTVLVKEIGPGAEGVRAFPTVYAGRLWFFADDGQGVKLWVSDGTPAGTFVELDATVLGSFFLANNLVSANGHLFFGGGTGTESGLWVSDGTLPGTQLIGPEALAPPFEPELNPVVFQGNLFYFAENGDLWRSDGTQVGTRIVAQVPGGKFLQPLGDRLYFTRSGELWVSDGTSEGTQPVGSPESPIPVLSPLQRAGQRIFFQGYDRTAGNELWAIGPP
jgi:ELWxxDGT repeat protein